MPKKRRHARGRRFIDAYTIAKLSSRYTQSLRGTSSLYESVFISTNFNTTCLGQNLKRRRRDALRTNVAERWAARRSCRDALRCVRPRVVFNGRERCVINHGRASLIDRDSVILNTRMMSRGSIYSCTVSFPLIRQTSARQLVRYSSPCPNGLQCGNLCYYFIVHVNY